MNRILLSIDLDEWYHARWCTGSSASLWPSTTEFFRDYYGGDRPIGELVDPVTIILDTLREFDVKATFFVLGEVANYYGELLREIVSEGHEIGCHGLVHRDMHQLREDEFIKEILEARNIIEKVTEQEIRAFRIPNAILPDYLVRVLDDMGFSFDSSLFPSRSFLGKYGYGRAPLHPYRPSYEDIEVPGDSDILELPLAVNPRLRLLAGSGIFTRTFGYNWSKIALNKLLTSGDTVYYFHPYELMPKPSLENAGMYIRLFFRNTGVTMRCYFRRLLEDFDGKFGSLDQLKLNYTQSIQDQ